MIVVGKKYYCGMK